MMPATRAVASASPLGSPLAVIIATTSGRVCTVPAATAILLVASLAVTSTMCAAPVASRCERPSGWEEPSEPTSSASLPVDDGGGLDERQLFGRQRERHVTERRQCAGAIGRQLADGVVVGIGR